MNVFNATIKDWTSWGNVFQSIDAFTPLIACIYQREHLPCVSISHLMAGTNAVFKVDNTVCKIFAPKESGLDCESDYTTELFGLKRAEELDIRAPRIIAHGLINDSYDFLYIIMEYVHASSYSECEHQLEDDEINGIARQLKIICNKLNTPCEQFNHWDVIERSLSNSRWHQLPVSFNDERKAYIEQVKFGNHVFVHTDLNPDNVLIDEKKNVTVIDFADAVLGPLELELVCICGLFEYDHQVLSSFFEEDGNPKDIALRYFNGLLIHDFGVNIIQHNFGPVENLMCLEDLKRRVDTVLNNYERD